MLRRILPFVVSAGLAAIAACNSADFTPAPAIDCSKTQCTCEQDPEQPTCKGYSGQPEGGVPLSDASPDFDANANADAETDASDDASADAGEDADAS